MKESFFGLILVILAFYFMIRILSKIDSKISESQGFKTDLLFISFLILSFILSFLAFYFIISFFISIVTSNF